MKKNNFQTNINGKLLCESFITVRLHNSLLVPGMEKEITLRDQPLGIAEVVSITPFLMVDIPDVIAYMDCGHDAAYLKTMLSRFYKGVSNATMFDAIVYKWTRRPVNMALRDLFENTWERIMEDHHSIHPETIQQ